MGKDFFDITAKTLTASNGLRAFHRRVNAPDVQVITRVREGSINEPPAQQGILHLAEHLLYRLDGGNIKRDLFRITGRDVPNAETHCEQLFFVARMPASDLEAYLRLWGRAFKNVDYSPEVFDTEKNVVIEEIAPSEREGTVLSFGARIRREYLYPGHALGLHPGGTVESVSKLTADDVTEYKRQRFNSSNTVLTIVGGYDESKLEGQINKSFGDLPLGEERPVLRSDIPEIIPTEQVARFTGIQNPELGIYFQVPGLMDEDRVLFGILKGYLGGGASSKLFGTIREEMGLAYGIGIAEPTLTLNRNIGIIDVTCFDENNYEKIVGAIMKEIEKVKQGDFDRNLLVTMKNGHLKRFWGCNLERLSSQASEIDDRYGLLLPHSAARTVEIWKEAKPEDLQRVAQNVFNGKYVRIAFYPA